MTDDLQAQFGLQGEVALVTGATGALGSAICRSLAGAGADVVIHHLGAPEPASALAEEVRSRGRRAAVVEGDVADPQQVAEMVEDAVDALGDVSILVNNAGVMEELPLPDLPLDSWRRTMDVDLDGVFYLCRELGPRMSAQGRGSIVNVASQIAYKGGPNLTSYAAAKSGVVGLTKALARELGPTVRVNAIAPGPLRTPMVEPLLTPEWLEQRTGGLVTRRLGAVEEVAPSVVFLCSPAGALFHGQTLHVNGGGVMP